LADPPSRFDGPTGDVRLQVAAFDLEEWIPLDVGFVFEDVDCGASDLSRGSQWPHPRQERYRSGGH
jgi:hypothetical protein